MQTWWRPTGNVQPVIVNQVYITIYWSEPLLLTKYVFSGLLYRYILWKSYSVNHTVWFPVLYLHSIFRRWSPPMIKITDLSDLFKCDNLQTGGCQILSCCTLSPNIFAWLMIGFPKRSLYTALYHYTFSYFILFSKLSQILSDFFLLLSVCLAQVDDRRTP